MYYTPTALHNLLFVCMQNINVNNIRKLFYRLRFIERIEESNNTVKILYKDGIVVRCIISFFYEYALFILN